MKLDWLDRPFGRALLGIATVLIGAYSFRRLFEWIVATSYSGSSSTALRLAVFIVVVEYVIPTAFGLLCAALLLFWLRGSLQRKQVPVEALPTARHSPWRRTLLALRRCTLLLIFAGYLVTWVFGVPAVHTAIEVRVQAEQEELRATRQRLEPLRPARIDDGISLP